MESIQAVFDMSQIDDWATTLDIKSAYSHVTVQAELRPYLAFEFEERLYRYRTVPFGLKTAPRVFTRLMRPVAQWIRQQLDTRICVYMDDVLILASSEEETRERTSRIKRLLTDLGLTLSPSKCHDQPRQQVKFLGWELDFQKQEISTPRDRRRTLLENLANLQTAASLRQTTPCRKLASLLGTLNFLRIQIPAASLYMGRLNRLKTVGVRKNGWNGKLTVTPMVQGEIKWWRKTLVHNTPHCWTQRPTVATLTTDASPSGWGATWQERDNDPIYRWGTWPRATASWTSNRRELTAILRAIKALTRSACGGTTICLQSDNTAAVFAIKGWKTSENRIPLLRKLWNLLQHRGLRLTAQYLPGSLNGTADRLSRMGASGEYYTTMEILEKAQKRWEIYPTLDAFASRETARLPRYCTKARNDAGALAVDGLAQSWREEVVLLHPPPALILRTVRKAMAEQARGLLLIPNWMGQTWTPLVHQLSAAVMDLGPYETVTRRAPTMMDHDWLLPPGRLTAHLMAERTTTEKCFSTN
jgi:ribonuclease HI